MALLCQALLILPIILACVNYCSAVLDNAYEWKYVDYAWRNDKVKAKAIHRGIYNYENILLNDLQPLPDGRILVTTPRFYKNPASLSVISSKSGDGGPLLRPYPSWSWHRIGDCSGITSVNRVILDDRNILWVVDSGKIGDERVCDAKILAFDPTTDELIQSVAIPFALAHGSNNIGKGILEIAAVETSADTNGNTWVYISDREGYGLIIWDGSDMWRLEIDAFVPDPTQSTFTIDGASVNLNIGLWSVFITPDEYFKEPALVFKPMTSNKDYAVSLEDLHNSKTGSAIDIYLGNFTAPVQELARAVSKSGGIAVAGFAAQIIACWNVQVPLTSDNIGYLDLDFTQVKFTTGVKITQESDSERFWALSVELPQLLLGTANWTDTNFRILTSDLATFVNGTPCEPSEEYEVADTIADKFFLYYETVNNALYKTISSADIPSSQKGERRRNYGLNW